MGNVTLPGAALVITGILLVAIGLFVAGEFLLIALGVGSLVAAGLIEVLVSRRA